MEQLFVGTDTKVRFRQVFESLKVRATGHYKSLSGICQRYKNLNNVRSDEYTKWKCKRERRMPVKSESVQNSSL